MEILIRSLNKLDLPQVMAIQRQNPSASQWKETDYASLIGPPGNLGLVAAEEGQPGTISGFAVLRQVADEAELLNLAVASSCKRRGVGRALIRESIQRLAQSHARRIFLEVRASNHSALTLYTSMGFQRQSLRKEYYQDPCEDGLVLSLALPILPLRE
ncbi:MAG TPA: ribosomal protein S18-alanine N-acetyltransferase [Terriglobia bacterium]|nr:ribosomal protein S18-alanine N-acetyltransferase [Terriglobia bacterium]